MSDTEFPKGLFVKAPPSGAPKFVKALLKIKIDEAVAFLESKQNEGLAWIDIDIKEARSGKWYTSINKWEAHGDGKYLKKSPIVGGAGEGHQSSGDDWGEIPF